MSRHYATNMSNQPSY